MAGFVELRNRVWGHGAGRDDAFYASILEEHRQRLEAELHRCAWLTTRALWLPKVTDEQGLVTVADLLNGDPRVKDYEVHLQLDPHDLDINGGAITPERTLLLVDEATGTYLPLFPLSLFRFQHTGHGLFFLNDLDWAEKAERLRKARYLAYDATLDDHWERAGEPAATRLEAHVRRLADTLPAQGVSLHTMTATVRDTPDYDLPGVWTEQAAHLKLFAGRERWLTRLRDWLDTATHGGYFLLLGPPGQGKSALLAQVAHHDGAGKRGEGV